MHRLKTLAWYTGILSALGVFITPLLIFTHPNEAKTFSSQLAMWLDSNFAAFSNGAKAGEIAHRVAANAAAQFADPRVQNMYDAIMMLFPYLLVLSTISLVMILIGYQRFVPE
ncbi:MAG TPA: hypothetical protein VG889_08070 [Rhizomicrobium sp.]|nr:hypothetical protein [Rhizomicrobium sp.]